MATAGIEELTAPLVAAANPRDKSSPSIEHAQTTQLQSSRKGDIALLKKADGTFYESVDFPTAQRYAGITPRRRQQLMKGDLTVIGKGNNRRITVESLLSFCPPVEHTK